MYYYGYYDLILKISKGFCGNFLKSFKAIFQILWVKIWETYLIHIFRDGFINEKRIESASRKRHVGQLSPAKPH